LTRVEAGLVCGGGEAVGVVPEREFNGPEELLVGEVGECFGHVRGGLFEEGPEAFAEGVDPRLAFSSVGTRVRQGVR
jgi:hypothetical protein